MILYITWVLYNCFWHIYKIIQHSSRYSVVYTVGWGHWISGQTSSWPSMVCTVLRSPGSFSGDVHTVPSVCKILSSLLYQIAAPFTPNSSDTFPDSYPKSIRPPLEPENLSSDRETAEGSVCTPVNTVQGFGTKFTWCSPASVIELDPGTSLNPDLKSVSCACLSTHLLSWPPVLSLCCKRVAGWIEVTQRSLWEGQYRIFCRWKRLARVERTTRSFDVRVQVLSVVDNS